MAKLKIKNGNTTYSWTSDDIRDAQITNLQNSVFNSIRWLPMNEANGYMIITFTGKVAVRVARYLLIIAGQSGPIAPITISFSGSWIGAFQDPSGTFVSINDVGVTADNAGRTVKIPQNLAGGWGAVGLFSLTGQFDEYTCTYSAT